MEMLKMGEWKEEGNNDRILILTGWKKNDIKFSVSTINVQEKNKQLQI